MSPLEIGGFARFEDKFVELAPLGSVVFEGKGKSGIGFPMVETHFGPNVDGPIRLHE